MTRDISDLGVGCGRLGLVGVCVTASLQPSHETSSSQARRPAALVVWAILKSGFRAQLKSQLPENWVFPVVLGYFGIQYFNCFGSLRFSEQRFLDQRPSKAG